LWTDPKVKALSSSEKLLFLYLITNPHSHYSGLYYLPVVMMQHEVNLGRGFEGALKGVQTPFLASYDPITELVWVKNMYQYQGKGKNMDKGVASHLATLHNSPLIHQFITYYPSVSDYFTITPFEPPSHPLTTSPSPDPDPVPVPSSDSSLILQEGKESEKGEFERFWQECPRKVGKKEALRAWMKASDKPPIDVILRALQQQKGSPQWIKDGGQFIPHPATWLNRGGWADKPTEVCGPHDPNGFLAGMQAFLERG
jgi:hypothetical protein